MAKLAVAIQLLASSWLWIHWKVEASSVCACCSSPPGWLLASNCKEWQAGQGTCGSGREPCPSSHPALGSLAYHVVKVKGFLEGSLQPVQD